MCDTIFEDNSLRVSYDGACDDPNKKPFIPDVVSGKIEIPDAASGRMDKA